MKVYYYIMILFLNLNHMYGQLPDSIFYRSDTSRSQFTVHLDPVTVIDIESGSTEERRAFYRTKSAVAKVYPYAQQALATMRTTDSMMLVFEKKRGKRKYLRKEEKSLKKEYKSVLRDFYVEEGRIMIKIIERETGEPFFNTLKKYKGGTTAVWWNSIAKLNGYSLKDGYDPAKEKYLELVLKAIESD